MAIPKWNDPSLKAGTMVRTALWLINEVGVGNVFTKDQHRQAFAGVTQADRRLRDLRKFGWVIHTNLEDVSLKSSEQRFVAAGQAVWDNREDNSAPKPLTAKERRAIFSEHNYQCSICGISGGERYLDSPETSAVLSIVREVIVHEHGGDTTGYSVQCRRCHSGGSTNRVDVEEVLKEIRNLNSDEKKVFVCWAESGRRNALDRIWTRFRQLPPAVQAEISDSLRSG